MPACEEASAIFEAVAATSATTRDRRSLIKTARPRNDRDGRSIFSDYEPAQRAPTLQNFPTLYVHADYRSSRDLGRNWFIVVNCHDAIRRKVHVFREIFPHWACSHRRIRLSTTRCVIIVASLYSRFTCTRIETIVLCRWVILSVGEMSNTSMMWIIIYITCSANFISLIWYTRCISLYERV